MENLRHTIDSLLRLLVEFGHEVFRSVLAMEAWLRAQLTLHGVAPMVQSVLLIALLVLLVMAALRVLGGLIRAAVVLFVVLIALHFVLSQH